MAKKTITASFTRSKEARVAWVRMCVRFRLNAGARHAEGTVVLVLLQASSL